MSIPLTLSAGAARMPTRVPETGRQMRRRPRQERSRATIEVILEAAAQVLGERGWKGITTNAVAETAGVSIGSIYQYYPNKLALIDGVRRRHFDEIRGVLQAVTDAAKPQRERIDALVDGMISAHSQHPTAHRVLLEDAPRGDGSTPDHEAFEADYLRAYTSLIASAFPNANTAERRISAQVLSSALAGATHDAARRGTLRTTLLRAELIKLVSRYLVR